MGKRINIQEGDRFGYLTVIREVEPNITPCGTVQRKFLCRCDCGNKVIHSLGAFRRSSNCSCGCKNYDIGSLNRKYTKEQTSSFLYSTWQGMKQRCLDPNSSNYANYGGRGITICDEWLDDYIKFYDWALSNGASKEMTLDRIDVNGDYEPSNCRWADAYTQANNTRQNRFIEYNGERLSVMQWSRITGIKEGTIRRRLDSYGYSVAEALEYEPHTKTTCDRSHTRKIVNQYSLDGEFIREWPSAQVASESLGISIKAIQMCVTEYYQSGGGYIWKYPNGARVHKQRRKKVVQYSLEGNFIAEHNDVFVASKATGVSHETIRDICKGRRIPRRIKFIFKFKEDAK